MRMLVQAKLPLEPFNTLVRNGSAEKKIQQALEEIRPEAVYFTEWGGHRTAFLVVDVAEPSRVPAVAEPLFLLFNAEVEFHVAMSPEDLAKAGITDLGRKYK